MLLTPRTVRIDVSTICQLKCPSCPTASGAIDKFVGSGFLKFADFKAVLEKNTWIQQVELTNWGEIFLNPELLQMLQYAHENGIRLIAQNGVNLNNVKPDILEALVKYGFGALSVSIDGATPETYAMYRVNGNLENVLANIRKLNEFKAQYNSDKPKLSWQYIVFGHNEHEVDQAREMARELNMTFNPKLNWEDMYDLPYTPVKDKEKIRELFGAADREEFREKFQRHFCSVVCQEMWTSPQINFDGEVLGCPVNHWMSYGNAFKENLVDIINGEQMEYTRQMLLGRAEERADSACSSCKIYKDMKRHNSWLKFADGFEAKKQPADSSG